ncbi:MAG: hypothetical protein E7384_00560 [Ruminococcaceae bacterium]|nr:hypothetical protein [Oscillospiraceae bacterium]
MDIGLVLSGGMAKGAYQVGALKAISEFIPREDIKCVSCASVGVLNGYAYVTGQVDKAEDMWRNFCADEGKTVINKVLKSAALQDIITRLSEDSPALSADFYTTLLDATNKTTVYKNLNVQALDAKEYLQASVAMPFYNDAIKIEGVSYFDGAVIDNIPVYPLFKRKLDYIVCIYFDDVCYKFENDSFDNRIIKVTFPSDSVIKQSVVFKKESIDRMIDDGYKRTKEILSKMLADGYENVESVYKNIEENDKADNERNLRVTGDVMVTNLNKITKRFVKRKIVL